MRLSSAAANDLPSDLVTRQIPSVSAGPLAEEHTPVVLWAHTGGAIVEVPGATHRLSAGDAIWIPPGVIHRTQTDSGGVVFPIFAGAPELRGALAEVRVITMPPAWHDWLVFQFDFNRYHNTGGPTGANALVSMMMASAPRADPHGRNASGPPLPMPRSSEGQAVARALLRSPESPMRADDFAARANLSVRTLQRQFRNETGIVLSEWRTRARVSAAARHLIDGRPVGWAGRAVGYDTPAGFTRAFSRHFGMSPSAYARRAGELAHARDLSIEPFSALVGAEPGPPPPIPPRQMWTLVHDCHVLWWTYRGTATIRIGTHEYALPRGHAIWLPAGLSASVELAAQSILLPLGQRYGALHLAADRLTTMSLPLGAEAILLHTMLTEYTLFQPATAPASLTDELFRKQVESSRGQDAMHEGTGAVAAIALAVRRKPADSRTLADWATRLHVATSDLGRQFLDQTGSSFPVWRAHARMTLAREMLTFGDTPRDVAHVLGYATPAVFAKVFIAAHGISPRRYQRRMRDAES